MHCLPDRENSIDEFRYMVSGSFSHRIARVVNVDLEIIS
jgi:hypothetical protein